MIDYKFVKEAYSGSGGFSNGEYLDKFPRESDEKFTERQKIAYYPNLFASKVNRYVGYLFKTTPMRTSSNAIIRQILDDIDAKGNAIDVFMSTFAKTSKALGGGVVLIDMPEVIPNNLQEQTANRAFPYVVNIEPSSITKYKLDRYGKFEYVAYSDTINNSTFEKEDIQEITRYFDKTGWKIYEKDEVIKHGEHNLGICPVLYFGENGVFPDDGEFNQIAYLQKRYYNLKSELDEILRGQTFSILTVNADSPSDIELKLSTDNALIYGNGMTRPSFIAPDSSSASIYQQEILNIEDTINKVAYDLSTNGAKESGIALDIKFQGLNGSLSNFALRLEDFEMRVFEVICKYLGINNDVSIEYPKTFNIIDVEKEITILSDVKALGYTLPMYEKLKLQQIISNDLNSVDNENMDAIKSEIEDVLKN